MTDAKATAAERLQDIRDEAIGLSHYIHANPELAFQEHRASRRVNDVLNTAGFRVQPNVAGLPTALAATHGDGELVIGLFAEYDALPGIGHACGHNIIAAAAVTAGRLLAPVAEDLGITVKIFGTPAEEAGGGKAVMLSKDVFAGVHAAMIVHPAPADIVTFRSMAVDHLEITYTGRTAHASGSPQLGRNAGDALTVAQVCIGLVRQHLPAGVQVHGIVTDGGEAPNVVPGHAVGRYYVRADTTELLTEARARIEQCFRAGALGTGCEVSVIEESPTYQPMDGDKEVGELYEANAKQLGRKFPDLSGMTRAAGAGSTDMGNVSQVIPSIHPMIGIDCGTAVNHQPEFAAYCGEPTGDQAVLDGALALAWTAIDLATRPEHRARLLAARPLRTATTEEPGRQA